MLTPTATATGVGASTAAPTARPPAAITSHADGPSAGPSSHRLMSAQFRQHRPANAAATGTATPASAARNTCHVTATAGASSANRLGHSHHGRESFTAGHACGYGGGRIGDRSRRRDGEKAADDPHGRRRVEPTTRAGK